MRIAVGSDHRGVDMRVKLVELLGRLGQEVVDVGCHGDGDVDYPDIAAVVARKVADQEADRGILICGSGLGMCIAANKIPGVRAAPCYDDVTAELSRRYNDSERPLPFRRHVGRPAHGSAGRDLAAHSLRGRPPRAADPEDRQSGIAQRRFVRWPTRERLAPPAGCRFHCLFAEFLILPARWHTLTSSVIVGTIKWEDNGDESGNYEHCPAG